MSKCPGWRHVFIAAIPFLCLSFILPAIPSYSLLFQQTYSFFDKAGKCYQNNWANGFQWQCNSRKAGKHFTHVLVNPSWYDIANHSRILIGSCLWSVFRRTLFKTSWFHVALRPSSIKITHDFKMWEESTTFSRHLWSIPLSSFLEDSRRVSRISQDNLNLKKVLRVNKENKQFVYRCLHQRGIEERRRFKVRIAWWVLWERGSKAYMYVAKCRELVNGW